LVPPDRRTTTVRPHCRSRARARKFPQRITRQSRHSAIALARSRTPMASVDRRSSIHRPSPGPIAHPTRAAPLSTRVARWVS